MSLDSTIYTMGTALSRAHDRHVPVALLVEGQWMRGLVAAIDGHGVVLAGDGEDHSVVKMDRVSAVRVMSRAPMHHHPSDIDRRPADGFSAWPEAVLTPQPEM